MKRLRRFVLRLARRRTPAVAIGLALALPAVWLELFGRFDAWWLDGLSLVAGATGVALVWAGVTGARPDWIDNS